VRWHDGCTKREHRMHAPAVLVAQLRTDLGGEPVVLEVIRPCLEDIYLNLVGASRADALTTEAALA
ncbi:MAG: ABC transporter ATP-binding protein, partial [Salinibacterium sp.]|nr:ABC transporter ATP-binding protein [Salinibacterium sp.]